MIGAGVRPAPIDARGPLAWRALIGLLANFHPLSRLQAQDEPMRKLLIGLAIVLTSCVGQVDLGRAVQQLQQPAAASPAAVASDASVAAVKQVIEVANQAQQKAFATGDSSVMRATAT